MAGLKKIYEEVENIEAEHIMDIMKELIGIDTSIPPGNTYREYVDAISSYFKELDYLLEEVIVPEDLVRQIPYTLEGPRINLVATKDFGQDHFVSFYGHMDVVPASEEGEQKWRYPPFEATINRRGKIFGRGVSDNKGAMVCLIIALQIIEKLNITLKYNVRVLNCTDEEVGVYPGLRYLAEKGYVRGIVFCMDIGIEPIVPIGLAGCMTITVETIGKSCHAGVNFMGVNALEAMVPILDELIKLKEKVEDRESKDIPGFPRFGTGEQRNMAPMFNLDIIQSGTKSNIVPDRCTLKIDRRIIPDENGEEVKKEIIEAIERGKVKSKALDVRTVFEYSYPPVKTNPNSPNISRFKKVMSLVQKVKEEDIRLIGLPYGSDMGFINKILNIDDIIITGLATLKSNSHGVNESVLLKDIKLFIKEIIVFLCADL